MKSLNYYITEKLIIRKSKHIDNWLRFTSLEKSNIKLDSKTNPNVEYSFDGKEWIEWDYSDIKLDKGQTVYMRGDNPNGFNSSNDEFNYFIMTGKIESHGNIMSLLYYDDFEDKMEIPNNYCFFGLFNNCSSLVTSPELPATKLTRCCYDSMFYNCTSLTQAPDLLASELAQYCYMYMFYRCKSLKQKPKIAADINNDDCKYMFRDCPCAND